MILNQQENANRAYLVTYNELLTQIELLQKNLKTHSHQQAKDRGNWGYSGDLTAIRNSLIEINAGFSG